MNDKHVCGANAQLRSPFVCCCTAVFVVVQGQWNLNKEFCRHAPFLANLPKWFCLSFRLEDARPLPQPRLKKWHLQGRPTKMDEDIGLTPIHRIWLETSSFAASSTFAVARCFHQAGCLQWSIKRRTRPSIPAFIQSFFLCEWKCSRSQQLPRRLPACLH